MSATNGKSESCPGENVKTSPALPASCNSDCLADIIFTVDFAAQKHKDQRRKDPEKTPYINHPIGLSLIIFYNYYL